MFLNVQNQVLAAALATAGTITVNYPTGYSKGDFFYGQQFKIVTSNGDVYSAPNDFITTLGATSVTVTWKRTASLPVGTSFDFQFDIDGAGLGNGTPGGIKQDLAGGAVGSGPKDVALPVVRRAQLVYISLGTPSTTSTTALLATTAATGAATTDIALATPFVFDVPRAAQIVSSTTDTTQSITLKGFDMNKVAQSEKLALNGATPVIGKKTWSKIVSYQYDINMVGNLSIGNSNVLGLPIFILKSAVQTVKELQDGTAASAGTFANGDVAAPLVSTGDVRGTYIPNAAPDGSKCYALVMWVLDAGYQGAIPV